MLCGPGIGDCQSLDTELLLDLQTLARQRFPPFLGQIGVDQIAHTLFQDIDQLLGELRLNLNPLR